MRLDDEGVLGGVFFGKVRRSSESKGTFRRICWRTGRSERSQVGQGGLGR